MGRKVVFCPSFVHHQTFLGKDLRHPLAMLARLPCNRHLESLAYIVDFTSVLLVSVDPSDPSKAGKEPFRHRINRIDGGLVCQLRGARSNVEADKIFRRHYIGSCDIGFVSSPREPSPRRDEASGAFQRQAASRRNATWSGSVRIQAPLDCSAEREEGGRRTERDDEASHPDRSSSFSRASLDV